MDALQSCTVVCPYCGEAIELLVDLSVDQAYVEDCSVCCRPLHIATRLAGDQPAVMVKREDE